METSVLEPIDLSSAVLKEQSGRWLVEATEYIADNPQIVGVGFIRLGPWQLWMEYMKKVENQWQ